MQTTTCDFYIIYLLVGPDLFIFLTVTLILIYYLLCMGDNGIGFCTYRVIYQCQICALSMIYSCTSCHLALKVQCLCIYTLVRKK